MTSRTTFVLKNRDFQAPAAKVDFAYLLKNCVFEAPAAQVDFAYYFRT